MATPRRKRRPAPPPPEIVIDLDAADDTSAGPTGGAGEGLPPGLVARMEEAARLAERLAPPPALLAHLEWCERNVRPVVERANAHVEEVTRQQARRREEDAEVDALLGEMGYEVGTAIQRRVAFDHFAAVVLKMRREELLSHPYRWRYHVHMLRQHLAVTRAGHSARVPPKGSPPAWSGGREVLTDNEYTVLRALKDKFPRLVLQINLAEDTGITRKTCGEVVAALVSRGLAERPSERSGATITPKGEALLKAANASPH